MQTKSTIISSNDVPAVQTGHSQVQFLAPPDLIGSPDMSIIKGTLPGPGIVPLHSHRDPESFYILSGEMDVYQEENGSGRWTRVKQGDLAVVLSNVKHAWRNLSSSPCVALILTGADVHEFLRGLGELEQLGPSQAADTLSKTMELAAQHHCWLATPEENAAIGLTADLSVK